MHKEIKEWLDNGVIDNDTSVRIENYIASKQKNTQSYFLVFGIIGSLLIGLGLMLIIAHNWDHFSIITKTAISLLPLMATQIMSGFVLFKKFNSDTWRESVATLLFFSIGASIALISQTYHMESDEKSFLLTWMLLALPVVYLMNSSMTFVLFTCGITFYGALKGYSTVPFYKNEYWLLFLLMLPFYIQNIKVKPSGLFTYLQHWILPCSLLVVFGSLHAEGESWMLPVYISLLSFFVLFSYLPVFTNLPFFGNGYRIVGFTGTLLLLFIITFKDWDIHNYVTSAYFSFSPIKTDFWTTIFILISFILIWSVNKIKNPFSPLFLVPGIIFLLFLFPLPHYVPTIVINFFILFLAVFYLRQGLKKNHLGILNGGLGILTILIFCRFFDTEISFVLRGIIFLLVGFGFFFANYYMFQKRKSDEK